VGETVGMGGNPAAVNHEIPKGVEQCDRGRDRERGAAQRGAGLRVDAERGGRAGEHDEGRRVEAGRVADGEA